MLENPFIPKCYSLVQFCTEQKVLKKFKVGFSKFDWVTGNCISPVTKCGRTLVIVVLQVCLVDLLLDSITFGKLWSEFIAILSKL